MPLEHAHSFLVHPAKNEDEQPSISGTLIPTLGQLYSMLNAVYENAPSKCNIEIVFRPDTSGRQHNESRDSLVNYCTQPNVLSGRAIAQRLQRVTTRRSGLGLLFLLTGTNLEGESVLVISRFPAEEGVVAQESATTLSVEFIERVFMKNTQSYKSAYFTTGSLDAGFWDGRAVDLQIKGPRDLSAYWIYEFLEADLRTTGPAGSRRLAVAVRDAVKTATNLQVKQELIAAAQLMRGLQGRVVSARTIIEQLAISAPAAEAIERAFSRPELVHESFRLDADEFDKHVLYRTVELDSGAMLVAEDSRWDQIFQSELSSEHQTRFWTEGEIIDERLKKTK